MKAEVINGSCGDNVYWEYDTESRIMTIGGSGNMENYSSCYFYPWRYEINEECLNVRRVNILEGVTSIGDYAFEMCTYLETVSIPRSMRSVGSKSFTRTRLNCVILNHTTDLPEIADDAFYELISWDDNLGCVILNVGAEEVTDSWGGSYKCYNVTYRGMCGENLRWYYGNNGKYGRSMLFITGTGDMTEVNSSDDRPWQSLLRSDPSSRTRIVIEEGITSICNWAFYDCYIYNGNLIIPEGVKTIGTEAFHGCKSSSISFPNSLLSIGDLAFEYCNNLRSVYIPSSVNYIAGNVFRGCGNIQEIYVDEENETYDSRDGCNAIIKTDENMLISGCKNSIIPNTVESIIGGAFYGLDITSIFIPSSVTNFYGNPFEGCKALTSIVVDEANEKYDSRNGCNAIIETATNKLIAGCANTIIPDGILTIGERAFINMSQITSMAIPNSVISIENSSFYDCKNLTTISCGENLSSIGTYVFAYCTGLEYIDLSECKSLPSITVSRSDGIFNRVSESTRIYLPGGKGHSDGGEPNVIIGRVCTGGVAITEGHPFENPVEFDTDEASYDRTFTSGVTATVCLPYIIAAANVTGGTFYSFGGVSNDYVVTMNEVTGDIQANTPYLFVPSSVNIGFNGTVTVCIANRGTNITTTQGNWTFCGTYEKIDWKTAEDFGGDLIYGFAANAYGEFVHAGDFVRVEPSNNSYINPYRAYLRYTAPSGAPSIYPTRSNSASLPERLTVKLVNHDGSATVIGEMERTNESKGMWYTVDGQRLSGKPTMKGVYINHGHKVIVK